MHRKLSRHRPGARHRGNPFERFGRKPNSDNTRRDPLGQTTIPHLLPFPSFSLPIIDRISQVLQICETPEQPDRRCRARQNVRKLTRPSLPCLSFDYDRPSLRGDFAATTFAEAHLLRGNAGGRLPSTLQWHVAKHPPHAESNDGANWGKRTYFGRGPCDHDGQCDALSRPLALVVKVLVVVTSRVEVDEGSEGRNLGISHERSSNGLKEDEIKSHRLV